MSQVSVLPVHHEVVCWEVDSFFAHKQLAGLASLVQMMIIDYWLLFIIYYVTMNDY